MRSFEGQPGPLLTLAFAPDGTALAAGGNNGGACVYGLGSGLGQAVSFDESQSATVNALAYSPDGSLIAAGLSNGHVCLYPIRDAAPTRITTDTDEPFN